MGRLIRLDWAIKKILRDKANFEILEGFLTELLGFEVSIQEILESESNRESVDDKSNRVDLLVKDQHGRLIIIEIQNESEADYLQRLMYGTSKAMVEHMQAGEIYASIKKLYSVSIVYFDLGRGEDYLYYGRTQFKGMRRKDELCLTDTQKELFNVQSPGDLFPEYYLIKVPKFDDKIRDALDEWIFFLKHEEIKDEFQARGLRSAKDKLDILKLSEEERKRYRRYLEDLSYQASMLLSTYGVGHLEGKKEGKKEGHEEGHKKGHKEGRLLTAERLLRRGMAVEEVAEVTDLSPEELKDIADGLT
ncbi:MAG: Rpn family recombination-promoting nuclease/putative transposase [Acidobacteriota bacterium]|nr:Rpn family recombination-promoting nuclease/putative transposase [Acidobacteriota bacterium]